MYLPAGYPAGSGGERNMFQTASNRIEDAKKEIEIMKKTGEKIRPIPFGEKNDTLFVSADGSLLLGFDVVEVDGVLYFIGLKRDI